MQKLQNMISRVTAAALIAGAGTAVSACAPRGPAIVDPVGYNPASAPLATGAATVDNPLGAGVGRAGLTTPGVIGGPGGVGVGPGVGAGLNTGIGLHNGLGTGVVR